MSVTQEEITEIQAKAIAIAKRGVSRVQTADRSHSFSNPNELYSYQKKLEADALDETYGGFIDVKMGNPGA